MPGYTEEEARVAIRESLSYAEALRKLGLRPSGGNHALFRRHVDKIWAIPTDHFDPGRAWREASQQRTRIPLEQVLVENCDYSRHTLKKRLFDTGLKERCCEMCGQDEVWHGRHMSMILDHINGVPNDNRLENLRIVCPNCAATLSTHCGRKNLRLPGSRECAVCGKEFAPDEDRQKHCSRACGTRHGNRRRGPMPEAWTVPRPPYEVLMEELRSSTYVAVGRKYGVTDNAIRKWVRRYRESAHESGE